MKKLLAIAGLMSVSFAFPAQADLVFGGIVDLGAQGFGNAPRLLTLQGQGNNTTESGVVTVSGGAVSGGAGAGIPDATVFSGNGVTNAGGDEVAPFTDNQKFNVPTLSSLNWNSADDVKIIFNATEPSGDGANITDVTLKFYSGDTVIAAIDGSHDFADTIVGNGTSGFLFTVDAVQQAHLAAAVFGLANSGDFRIALESTISGISGGPESFSAVVAVAPAVPEPSTWAMMLLGFAGLAAATYRRRKTAVMAV
jgi:hypothetical protein